MKKIYLLFLLIPFSVFSQNESYSQNERIYALSSIWKEMSYNFAFPERFFEFNMDSLYLSYLPKMKQEMDNYDFYRLLSSYMAHFREAHTRIYTTTEMVYYPPLFATTVEDAVVVKNVSKELEDKIPIGSEIVKVSGIPVADYIIDSVMVYISASTDHWRWNKSVLELFGGRKNTQFTVDIKRNNGQLNRVILTRNSKQQAQNIELVNSVNENPIYVEFINNYFAYIKLNSFQFTYKDSIENVFINQLPKLRKAKGLIIDIRNNRGGTDSSWELIAKYLIKDREFQIPCKFYSKKHISSYVTWGKYVPQYNDYTKGIAMEEIIHSHYINEIEDSLKLNQPIVVLSGKYTGSAAEDFLLLMKESRRALVIGSPSVGCVGEPSFYPLNNEYGFMISTKKYVLNDGKQPNDTGIFPDIDVNESFSDYKKGLDNILDQAIYELKILID